MALFDTLKLGGYAVYPLLALGFIMTVIIIDKAIVHLRYGRLPRPMRKLVETYNFDWVALEGQLQLLPPGNVYRRFLGTLYTNRTRPAWWLESRAGDEAALIEAALTRHQWVLETIVTAAPLIGLLGTILGMMSAFKIIGTDGLMKPEEVTGGVAEALIATAFGLLIALVALFAFNYLTRRTDALLDTMERLGTRLIDHIRLDEVNETNEAGHEA